MQLSPECRSLLDRIFDTDVKQRITVDGIMQHPWYLQPLTPQYQAQLQHLDQVQAEKEAHITSRQLDPVCFPFFTDWLPWDGKIDCMLINLEIVCINTPMFCLLLRPWQADCMIRMPEGSLLCF